MQIKHAPFILNVVESRGEIVFAAGIDGDTHMTWDPESGNHFAEGRFPIVDLPGRPVFRLAVLTAEDMLS